MILANLGFYKRKQHKGSKPPHLMKLRDAYSRVIHSEKVASYNLAGRNGRCNYDASTLKGNPSATRGLDQHEILFLISPK
jgi:hypothetical protein